MVGAPISENKGDVAAAQNVEKNVQRQAAFRAAAACVGCAAAVWLAGKDWLLSDVIAYPYAASERLSFIVVICVLLARFAWRPNDVCRNVLTVLAAVISIAVFSLQSWQYMLEANKLDDHYTKPLMDFLSPDLVFSIGVFALAMGVSGLPVKYVDKPSAGADAPQGSGLLRLGVDALNSLRGVLKAKVTLDALYCGAFLAGALCIFGGTGLRISDKLYAAVAAVLGIAIVRMQSARAHAAGDAPLLRLGLALLYASPAVCWAAALIGAAPRLKGDPHSIVFGAGLTDVLPPQNADFLTQEGMLASVLLGLTVLLYGLACARIPVVDPGKVNHAARWSAAATVALSALFLSGYACANLLAAAILGASVVILVISSRGLPAAKSQRSRPRLLLPAVIVLTAASCAWWLVGLSKTVDRLAGLAPSETVSDKLLAYPVIVRAAVAKELLQSSWPDEHRLVRRYCGARIPAPESVGDAVALQAASGGRPLALPSVLSAVVLQSMMSSRLAPEQVMQLFLAQRDYGGWRPAAHAIGIPAAAHAYFGKAVGQLTETEAHFLVRLGLAYSDRRFRLDAASDPLKLGVAAPAYAYAELARIPNMSFMMHQGQINRYGLVAGSVVTHQDGTRPFYWQAGRLRMLKGPSSVMMGVNDAGVAVSLNGMRWDANGASRVLNILPGFAHNAATAINNLGQIVGYCSNDTSSISGVENLSHAYLWEKGAIRDLGVPAGYVSTRAYAINDRGQIAGFAVTVLGKSHAVVWDQGQMHDLGTYADGDISRASSINNTGEVVGQGTHADGSVTAFLWCGGVMHDLGVMPGDLYSRARSINDSGTIVGESRPLTTVVDATGGRSFVWDVEHGMRPLVPLLRVDKKKQAALTLACAVFSINRRGQILGINRHYPIVDGQQANFVLTPAQPASTPLHSAAR